MSSYAVSQEFSPRLALWIIGKAIYRTDMTVSKWVRNASFGWLWSLLTLFASDAKALCGGLATATVWTVGLAAAVGVLMLVLSVPELVIAAVVILAYALVFKPR